MRIQNFQEFINEANFAGRADAIDALDVMIGKKNVLLCGVKPGTAGVHTVTKIIKERFENDYGQVEDFVGAKHMQAFLDDDAKHLKLILVDDAKSFLTSDTPAHREALHVLKSSLDEKKLMWVIVTKLPASKIEPAIRDRMFVIDWN